ncbi:ryncolin-1-like [Saccoglossus kowalevskii]
MVGALECLKMKLDTPTNHRRSERFLDNKKNDLKKDFYDIQQNGYSLSGVYSLRPDDDGVRFRVYCDMDTDGGGWTVIQRRENCRLDFYQDWQDYKDGFGIPGSEHWLGNDKIYRLTNQGPQYELRFDLEDFEGETRYAKYDNFAISDEFTKYRLTVGAYSGTAGDSVSEHAGLYFSTRDRDNDVATAGNCAVIYKGAWWYGACHSSNLNGLYHGGQTDQYATGVVWNPWRGYNYSLKHVEMKIRPII